jgi:hypothetical protein
MTDMDNGSYSEAAALSDPGKAGAPEFEIELTSEMVATGVDELRLWFPHEPESQEQAIVSNILEGALLTAGFSVRVRGKSRRSRYRGSESRSRRSSSPSV